MINITDHSFSLNRLHRESERASKELHESGQHLAASKMEEYSESLQQAIDSLRVSQE